MGETLMRWSNEAVQWVAEHRVELLKALGDLAPSGVQGLSPWMPAKEAVNATGIGLQGAKGAWEIAAQLQERFKGGQQLDRTKLAASVARLASVALNTAGAVMEEGTREYNALNGLGTGIAWGAAGVEFARDLAMHKQREPLTDPEQADPASVSEQEAYRLPSLDLEGGDLGLQQFSGDLGDLADRFSNLSYHGESAVENATHGPVSYATYDDPSTVRYATYGESSTAGHSTGYAPYGESSTADQATYYGDPSTADQATYYGDPSTAGHSTGYAPYGDPSTANYATYRGATYSGGSADSSVPPSAHGRRDKGKGKQPQGRG
ncbi:hypothetical protein [Streptomyces sp. HUAS ZL42]|uniref:hypothetical protein n=1 Tax=Streptomyces sp. HUAS ZL42 TaxID=3231715 RepID=UPI00345E5999